MNENPLLSAPPDVVFSGSAMLGYCLTGIVYLLLPVGAFLWMKSCHAARLYPVIVGMVMYFLTTRLSDLCAYMIGYSLTFAAKTVIAAELVCVFEEVGRWLALRSELGDIRKNAAAVCYGIGHGGLECWIRSIQQWKCFGYGIRLNSDGIGSFLTDRTEEDASAVISQLQGFADHPLYLSVLEQINAVTTFAVQIALTMLLFRKMQETGYQKRWLLLAVVLHYFLNGSGWLASFTGDALFCAFISILVDVIVIMLIFRLIDGKKCIEDIRFPMNETGNIDP